MGNTQNNLSITKFDKQKIFETKCKPHMQKFADCCKSYGIPFFVSACISNTKDGSMYATDAQLPDLCGVVLQDDKITSHLKINQGYEAKIPGPEFVIDMDQIDSSGDADGFFAGSNDFVDEED